MGYRCAYPQFFPANTPRSPIIASGLGAQRLISDEDVDRARTQRRTDLPGQPLVWQPALRRMIVELAGKRCA
jgi:alkylation response protein AidB-like acyl-CoA dehydrogenase